MNDLRRKALAWLSTLLIVTGILMPAVTVGASHRPGSWSVSSSGPEYSNGKTIFTYTVTSEGEPHALSHLSIALCDWLDGISANPPFNERGPDPTTGLADALKWESGVTNGTTIRVEYEGLWPAGSQVVVVKAGGDRYDSLVTGPDCRESDVDFTVEKSVSTAANPAAGQSSVTLEGGGQVNYLYTIRNTGDFAFTIQTASDDVLGAIAFTPTTVHPGEAATGTASKTFPTLAPGSPDQVETNTITATVSFAGTTYGPKAAQATVVNRAPAGVPDFTLTKTVSRTNDPSTGQPAITIPLQTPLPQPLPAHHGTAYYFYTLTNTGTVPLTITSSVDDKLGAVTFAPNPVPAGGTATAMLSKTFDMPEPGSLWPEETNTVTVTATGGSQTVERTASAKVTLVSPRKEFTLTKTVSTVNDPATGQPSVTLSNGGTVYYFYTISNNGDVPIEITHANDDILGDLPLPSTTVPAQTQVTVTLSKTFPALPPGSGSVTEVNTATVSGAYKGTEFCTRIEQATVINNPPAAQSSFTLTKRVNTTNNAATAQASVTLTGGGMAYYFYTITNSGTTTLTLVSASDDKLGPLTFTPATLAPGGTATATADKSFSAPAEQMTETNIVTVVMADPTTELEPVQATASVVNLPGRSLTFTITKTVSATNNLATGAKLAVLNGGGTAYYFYTFTNTSTVPLTITDATDDILGALAFTPGTVPAGGTATATASKHFAAPSIGSAPLWETNTVSVTAANDGRSVGPLTDMATVQVYAESARPDFTLTKRVSASENPATGQASITLTGGGTAHFFYTLTNTGNVPLTISSAADDRIGPLTFTPATVAPGGTAAATASKFFAALPSGSPDQTEVNTAAVTAEWDGMAISRSAQATVTNRARFVPEPEPDHPSFSVTKRVSTSTDPATGQASVTLTGGGTVHYFYTITNTGDVPLSVQSAVDDRLGAITFTPVTLMPGATASATAAKTFSSLPAGTAAEVETNTLTVRMLHGTALIGPQHAQAAVTNNAVPARPSFRLEKLASTTNDPATGSSSLTLTGGGTVYYFYTVTNTGNVPLTITSAVDDKLGAVAFTPLTLAPGASATAMKSKVFPGAATATSETNVVTVRAAAGSEVLAEQKATAVVHATPDPRGSVEVRVLDGSLRNGGTPVPIAGAAVTLTGGLSGTTDANGRIAFPNLPFQLYMASAESGDPVNAAGPIQSGSGSATISQASPNGVITIILAWEYAPSISVAVCQTFARVGGTVTATGPDGSTVQVTAPGSDGRYLLTGLSAGTWTVTMTAPGLPSAITREMALRVDETAPRNAYTLDVSTACPATTGGLTGQICSPARPGAEVRGEGPNGQEASAFVTYDGTVGKVRHFLMNGLAPGLWKLTLLSPGRPAVSRTVVVEAGITVAAPDFALACTGTPAPVGTYGASALLILAGLALRWYSRRRPV